MVDRSELSTERLLLRPFRLDDVDDVFVYAKDEAWGRYLIEAPHPYERNDAVEFVARSVLASWDEAPLFALEYEGRVVGGAGLDINNRLRNAELGYSLSPVLWGRGLMPEATAAVLTWGFKTYDIAKVFARADARNAQSTRVMEKLGMTREGLLRKQRFFLGEQVDEVIYGLLREEWEARPPG